MCGAAAESIMLVVAVALKKGDSAAVESAYLSGGGGGKVEKWITSGITPQLQDEWKRYTSLLNYWRDSAAHGRNSHIGENEAYTALLLLLRFAMFASDRWAELTQTN
jgi:hypothetical protein